MANVNENQSGDENEKETEEGDSDKEILERLLVPTGDRLSDGSIHSNKCTRCGKNISPIKTYGNHEGRRQKVQIASQVELHERNCPGFPLMIPYRYRHADYQCVFCFKESGGTRPVGFSFRRDANQAFENFNDHLRYWHNDEWRKSLEAGPLLGELKGTSKYGYGYVGVKPRMSEQSRQQSYINGDVYVGLLKEKIEKKKFDFDDPKYTYNNHLFIPTGKEEQWAFINETVANDNWEEDKKKAHGKVQALLQLAKEIEAEKKEEEDEEVVNQEEAGTSNKQKKKRAKKMQRKRKGLDEDEESDAKAAPAATTKPKPSAKKSKKENDKSTAKQTAKSNSAATSIGRDAATAAAIDDKDVPGRFVTSRDKRNEDNMVDELFIAGSTPANQAKKGNKKVFTSGSDDAIDSSFPFVEDEDNFQEEALDGDGLLSVIPNGILTPNFEEMPTEETSLNKENTPEKTVKGGDRLLARQFKPTANDGTSADDTSLTNEDTTDTKRKKLGEMQRKKAQVNETAPEQTRQEAGNSLASQVQAVAITTPTSTNYEEDGLDDATTRKLRQFMYYFLPPNFKYTKAEIYSMPKERLLEIRFTDFLRTYEDGLKALVSNERQQAVESAEKEKDQMRIEMEAMQKVNESTQKETEALREQLEAMQGKEGAVQEEKDALRKQKEAALKDKEIAQNELKNLRKMCAEFMLNSGDGATIDQTFEDFLKKK